MTPEQKHARADALKAIIEQQQELIGKFRRANELELSQGSRGYTRFAVTPFHQESDVKGNFIYTPLENRLTTNPIQNLVVNFIEELIQLSEKELLINQNEYAALFSAE